MKAAHQAEALARPEFRPSVVPSLSAIGMEWVEQRSQSSYFGCKAIVLGRQDRYLLLGNPEPGLGLVSLLLSDLGTVAPEARGNGLFWSFISDSLCWMEAS